MNNKLCVIGSYLSPYVRKVLVVLAHKGLEYEIDPVVPFFGNDAFTELSPARKIPVLLDGAICLADSTIILEYLNEMYPDPDILPGQPAERARLRWFEEYADSVLGDVFIWEYWNQAVINRFVWGKEPDQAILKVTVEDKIPQILDYLESQLPVSGSIGSQLSVADLSIAAFFRNLALGRYAIDRDRWPVTAGFVGRTLALPCFTSLNAYEELSLRHPIDQHRSALAEAGAPVSRNSYGETRPRMGLMTRK
jgi:glutathione S-transferase